VVGCWSTFKTSIVEKTLQMIFDLFSKREKKKELSGRPDVYQYDDVSRVLRVQIQQILIDAIGRHFHVDPYGRVQLGHNPDAWQWIHKTLCRELGVHCLDSSTLEAEQVLNFIGSTDADAFVDAVELCALWIDRIAKPLTDDDRQRWGITQQPQEALDEINYRFRQAGFGYQFEDGEVFRVDSQFTHEELVKPALKILNESGFEGPQAEFLEAHRKYRSGEYEQSVVEAGKAFESSLKVICDKNGWVYDNGARTSDLLKVVRAEGLWPDYLDGSFNQLVATLASGLPKVRNDAGAHGQGSEVRTVPAYIAHYALNLCAAKLALLAQANADRPR
jgi:hypothetical protein